MSANPYKNGTQEWLAFEAAQGMLSLANMYPNIIPHFRRTSEPTVGETIIEGQSLDETRRYSLSLKLNIRILMKAAREAGFIVIENDRDRSELRYTLPAPDEVFGKLVNEIPADYNNFYSLSKGIYYPYADLWEFFKDDVTYRYARPKDFFRGLNMLDGPNLDNHALLTYEDPFSKNNDMFRCCCKEKEGLGVQIWNDMLVPEIGDGYANMFLPIPGHVKRFEEVTQKIKPMLPTLLKNFEKRHALFKKNSHMADIKSAGFKFEA